MTPIVLDAGAAVNFSDGVMERDARLLVTGSYPGKNLTVTEADLDALVANFSGPIPVKVEHIDSPLDPLGLVVSVRRQGGELLGRVKFPAEMASFLSSRNANKLSIGLLKEPVWRLLEASLTLTPHVPSATLLSDGERVELASLRVQLRKQTVDAQIAELKASGQVVPATEALARVLLSANDAAVVTLSDGSAQSVAAAALALLRALPPLVQFGELAAGQAGRTLLSAGAAGAAGSAGEDFTEEEHEIMRRLGVKPEDVSDTMARDGSSHRAAKKKGAM